MPDGMRNTSSCGWMIKRCVYPSAETVAAALAESIANDFENAPETAAAIMLAGGRTPKAAYAILTEKGLTAPPGMHIAISDERYVPMDSPDSNLCMMNPFLNAVQCPPERRITVNTSLDKDAAATGFAERFHSFFQNGGMLQTAYLGLGTDGHTASLFSESDLKAAAGKYAIPVDRPDGRTGISATPEVIQKAKRIVFVVTGREKREIVRDLLKDPASTIAGNVAFRHPNVELWIDTDAASA